jgi:membrane associated rhomboid family serine protease
LLAHACASAYVAGLRIEMAPTGLPVEKAREPVFNLPPVILGLVAYLVFVHVVVAFALPASEGERLLELFAFDPLRYHANTALGAPLPGGFPAAIWTFVTYAFFHANVPHLAFNLIWLVAFGTPVARRFGPWRFLTFFAFTAAGGALAHLVTHIDEDSPAIGASAAVLGMMAAALRFVFQPGGPLGLLRLSEAEAYRVPAKPLAAMLRDRRMLLFLTVWFVFNGLSALPWLSLPGIEANVAWQAHVGGFVAGLVGFSAFDPRPDMPSEVPLAADIQSADDETPRV